MNSNRYLLYAEDDPDDQKAMIDMVSDLDPKMEVITCEQGLELMQYLEDLKSGASLPCCIVLDMNMPIWDGLRTLQELKRHPVFTPIPVVVFSTSDASRDAERATRLGAQAFISKPVHEQDFKAVAKEFSLFCNFPSMQKVN